MQKLFGIIGGATFGAAFVFIGYRMFSGDPIEGGGRKGRAFLAAQDWLIEKLGMTNGGILLMAVGIICGLYFIWASFQDDDDE